MSSSPLAPTSELLRVRDLRVSFATRSGLQPAVNGVSFSIAPGEIVGLVGESGCGKTTVAHSLMGLLPKHARVSAAEIVFDQHDILHISESEMRRMRGQRISLIVQDALAALNPVRRVGEQLLDELADHEADRGRPAKRRVIDMFRNVGLSRPEMRFGRYAHELSGGMQQRVLIAAALLLGPQLIIADEPTTALDVTIQAQILALLRKLRSDSGAAILFVTHDLSTVAELCDRVLVMYAGEIVEEGPVDKIFRGARHPYTRGLLASIPPLDTEPPEELPTIPGTLPAQGEAVAGCPFAVRCDLRASLGEPTICTTDKPIHHGTHEHWAACHFVAEPISLGAAG